VLPDKVAQIEVAGLNEDEMALVIKRFKTALKGCKDYPNESKSRGKHTCFKCGKSGHFIPQCPDNENDQDQDKKGKKKFYRKKKGESQSAKNGTQIAHPPTLMTKDSPPSPSTGLLSSPTSDTHVSRLRRRTYIYVTYFF
jgi:hypothetical protein